MSKRKDISTALLGVAIALILWITILSREKLIGTPISYRPFHALFFFLQDIQKGRISANFLGNVILFMPVGMLVPMVTDWKMWRTVIVGSWFSLCIEIIQLITSKGCFDPDDVILNTVGTLIGFGLYCVAQKLFKKDLPRQE